MKYYVVKCDDGSYQAGQSNNFTATQKRKAVSIYSSNLAASKKAAKLNSKQL